MTQDPDPFFDQPVPRKLSTGAKVGIGCGIAVAAVLILTCVGGYLGIRWGLGKLDEFAEEYEQQGYVRVSGQVVDVTQAVTEPTVYTCQILTLKGDVDADIAIMAQTVQIHGTVSGDVDFYGQLLMVHQGAVIEGDLNVKGAQVIELHGRVDGEITGSYQTLRDLSSSAQQPSPGAPPDPPDPPDPPEPVQAGPPESD